MKNDIEKIYLIDRYLKGELFGLTLDEFKSKLRNDSDFANEVETQKAIIEGIKLARREQLISVLKGEIAPTFLSNSLNNREDIKASNSEVVKTEDSENTYQKSEKVYSIKPVSTNWYFAAAAILFAGFFLYLVFGYYIPHKKLLMAQKDTINNTAPEPVIKDIERTEEEGSEEPELAVNPFIKDSLEKKDIDIATFEKPKLKDTINVVKDKKISETIYSVSAFETIKTGGETGNNVSAGDNTGSDLKSTQIRKVRGSTVKVEYWESIVNFKGYKLNSGNLKLFDVKTEEKVKLKYLDKSLYLNKNGNYYKLNDSGSFESYQKETNSEIIKLLEIN